MNQPPASGEALTARRYNLIELADTLTDVVSLGRGDPDLDTPPHVIQQACRSLAHGAQVTPVEGLRELRAALAEHYRRDKGLEYDPDTEVLVTNGAQEGLFLAMLALVNPGDGVMMGDPRYSSYDQAVAAAGGRLVVVPTRLEDDFALGPEQVRAAAPDAKVLVLVNPNNPTSALIHEDAVRAIAEEARAAGLIVISDEIYENLVFDGQRVLPVASCPGMREATVTLSGFSKTYAMTGFRMGYLLAPAPFIAAATALKARLSGPSPVFSQYAALAALTGPQDAVAGFRATFDRRRRLMADGLSSLGIRFGHPGGGFYVWADISRFGLSADDFCHRLLTEARVLIFPGTSFGTAWGQYVRISLLQPEDRLREAVARLERFVGTLSAARV